MKVLGFIALFVAANSFLGRESKDDVCYVSDQDTVRIFLTIEGDAYRLLAGTLGGERFEESGSVERDDVKIRFVVSEGHECKFGGFLRKSWFVPVTRKDVEYLVKTEEVADLDRALEIDPDRLMWFSYFERVVPRNEEGSIQLPEPNS